jgi:lipopolysaccharide transport system ATP-binding protein
MSEPAVVLKGIGKEYKIGGRQRYLSLRESITTAVRWPLDVVRGRRKTGGDETFWALDDVSFHVNEGESVAIIGHNGAGKSTLLKVLARITEPTRGRAEIRGRMSSLLEVGTGFHPELTGRENVYLNGAILGMKKPEVERCFDAIVAFAEVERFIDTAVKHYSTGMYLRLAFAVAAHLEPDILVVDEVLAVGDASFQRKCLTKMAEAGSGGRTVLFVSHNMAAVTRLCSRAILLEGGRVVDDGPAIKVVGSYIRSGTGTSAERRWDDPKRRPGNEIARLHSFRVVDEKMNTSEALPLARKIGLEMTYEVLTAGHRLVPNFHFYSGEGTCIFVAADVGADAEPRPVGIFTTKAWIPAHLLNEGSIFVGAALSTVDPVVVHFWEKDAVAFQVTESIDEEDASRSRYAGEIPGVVRPKLTWETERARQKLEPSRAAQAEAVH